jgi:phosphoglycolate phosphatase
MNYQAVLFDLDGTLLDTLTDVATAANRALRSLGFPEHSRDSFKYFIGDGVESLVRRVLPKDACDLTATKRFTELLRTEYGRCWAATTRPYEGIPELLNALTMRHIPFAVFSNKPDEFTRLCISQLLRDWQFAEVLGTGPSLPNKPDPAGAIEIARRLGIVPADMVYLGDTKTDMQMAIAARMYPVGALRGFRPADELISNGAKATLEEPLDLMKLL